MTRKGGGSKSDKLRLRVIAALLEHGDVGTAARACGVGQSTVYEWLSSDLDFQRQYAAARRPLIIQTAAALQSACSDAVATLQEIANDSGKAEGARVAAAKVLLDQTAKATTVEQVEMRLSEMERAVALLAEAVHAKDIALAAATHEEEASPPCLPS